MNTISLDSLGREKISSASLNLPVAVNTGRLVTFEHAAFSGVFQSPAGSLPSISAKSFRITNASGASQTVGQKQVFFSKQFETDTGGMAIDSPSLSLSTESDPTPLGQSEVLKLVHNAGTAAYHTVDNVGLDGVLLRCYFKIESLSDQVQPIGIYTEFNSIDINFPAAAIRVNPDLTISARVGDTETSISSSPVTLGVWHRATISINGTSFIASVERYTGSSYIGITNSISINSVGNGLLSEVANNSQYVIAVASEGVAIQYIDGLEGFITTGGRETILNGETKEYFCQTSLDEFDVSGACSGYYRR
jgi:hypothetical protein